MEIEKRRLAILNSIRGDDSLWRSYYTVKSTTELITGKKSTLESSCTLKKSWMLFIVAFIAVSAYLTALYYFLKNDIVLYIFLPMAIFMLIFFLIRNTQIPDSIIINKDGLSLGKAIISWDNIFQTYIVKEPFGRSVQTFLWIALKDGNHEKINISNYGYRHVGQYIEQYRRIYIPEESYALRTAQN